MVWHACPSDFNVFNVIILPKYDDSDLKPGP